jgi:polyvinyl alcohol dehydrogenase (cytochrome)
VVWKTYTVNEEPVQRGPAARGQPNWGPSGGAIWSAPTIDSRRGVLYVGTGNNYTPPATGGTDAIMAMDLRTGQIKWSRQLTENDVWNTTPGAREQAPDFDFGSSPILTKGPGGRDIIVAPQKSGIGWALDPDRQGATVWQYRAGRGSSYGGIEWGAAVDGRLAFFPVSDVNQPDPGGLHAVNLETGARVWHAPPAPARCQVVNRSCNSGQPAAATAIPGIVFSGAIDGMLRAYSSQNGSVVWEFNTSREFETLNGVAAAGGSINGPGPTVAGGRVYVNSGYGLSGRPGNVLLAFGVD